MSSTIEYAERKLRARRQMRIGEGTRTTSGTKRQRLALATVTLPERAMMRHERPGTGDGRPGEASLKYFVPFKDFYGGWLVYELAGRRWRQYATPAEMRAAGVGFTSPI